MFSLHITISNLSRVLVKYFSFCGRMVPSCQGVAVLSFPEVVVALEVQVLLVGLLEVHPSFLVVGVLSFLEEVVSHQLKITKTS
jgi:hypothetical protein